MTNTENNSMNDQEINAAIAEYCEWTNCRYIHALRDTNGIPPENWKGRLISGLDVAWIPNYCNDLNAMQEAEKVLTDMQWHTYLQDLAVVVREKGQAELQIRQYVHATARQRAEAFLRTIGEWKEL